MPLGELKQDLNGSEADLRVLIKSDVDIVKARQSGRSVAEQIGFSSSEMTIIATAISEVARNIIKFAKQGFIFVRTVDHNNRAGIEVIARDEGPGIADVDLAMKDGYSTDSGLGLGLPGCKRLMDEFELKSTKGEGTTVIMRKWLTTRGENHRTT